MARSVSATFEAAVYAQQTAEVFHIILAVSHADMSETLRLVNNTEDVTSNA